GFSDVLCVFFFASRRRHTRLVSDWSSDVCSSDLWSGQVRGSHQGVELCPIWRRWSSHWSLSGGCCASRLQFFTADCWRLRGMTKIGRASCRGRGGSSGGAGWEKKESDGRNVRQ